MSNLASLLNPAPSSDSRTSASVINGTAHHKHDRHPSLTSPLEALAIAATSTPPVLSPTHSTTTPFVSPGHQQSFSSSSSRPSSSHISLPMPHALAHPTNSFPIDHHSPTHHISSRRLSDIANGASRELPPLRRAQPEDMISSATTSSDDRSTIDSQEPLTHSSMQRLPPLHQTVDMVVDGAKSGLEKLPVDYAQDTETIVHTAVTDVGDFRVNNSGSSSSKLPQLDGSGELPPNRDGSLTPKIAVFMKREDSTQSLPLGGAPMADDHSSVQATHPAASKKRPAPKAEKKIEKKGIASAIKKPTAKKRKLDADSMDGTPFSQRSGTPASSRASKTPVPRNRKQSSVTPLHSSPAPGSKEVDENDDEDIDDDSELFCICRKPDDHTWMIGCDGGCEDWFHGRCVKMNERDGNLIDKYICPNCYEKGIGQTTWKPMCRLETCREPARVTGSKPSKYCCDEHGEQFMAMRSFGKNTKMSESFKAASAAKKRRKDNYTDNTGNGGDNQLDSAGEEDQPYLRGGVLRASELKAITSGVKNVEEFKKLGEGVLSPPRTVSPDGMDVKAEDGDPLSKEKLKVVYTPEEEAQLADITLKKASLKRKREALGDREKFFGLVKARAKTVLEEMKKKEGTKEICGYDSRLTWSDEEFDAWRSSNDGQKALRSGVLGSPSSPADNDGDEEMANGDSSHTEEIGRGVCQKKRCERHKQWVKLQQQDIAFAKEECRQEMRKLESEEKGVGERAMIRHLEGGDEAEAQDKASKADGEFHE